MRNRAKGIDWDEAPLGESPDAALARFYGVAHQVVQTARVRRGIPRFVPKNQRLVESSDWETAGLGERPDQAIAAELGVGRRRVCYERNRRGIPAFIGLVLTQEGDPCRSIYEAMLDAYLHSHRMVHKHEVAVPGLPFIADFRVGVHYVEVVGMSGFDRYQSKHEQKQRAYEDAGILVRWIGPEEVRRLFNSGAVPLRFRARECARCGTNTHDLVTGVCRPCYMRQWHERNAEPRRCESCRRSFAASATRRFCSRTCYWKSIELDWPSWDELDRLLQEKPIRQVAIDLNVRESTLYMRLRRRRIRRGPIGRRPRETGQGG
jgi:hypothetical protein